MRICKFICNFALNFNEMLVIGDISIAVERKAVRRLRLRVKPDGSVHLSVPWWMPMHRAETFVAEQYDWLVRTRDRMQSRPRQMMRDVSDSQREALVEYLTAAVPMWCERMGEAPVTFRLRNMRSQWGNCRWRERLITFNLQLALVPHHLVDYIIVHELAHLQVQNHGPEFHARVQAFVPDERARRRELNKILKE